MEPAELRLGVVTRLQGKACGRVVGSDARVLLADVSHPGIVKVLILSQTQREGVILSAVKSYKCTFGQSVTLSFIYGGLASVLDTKLFVFRSKSGLG